MQFSIVYSGLRWLSKLSDKNLSLSYLEVLWMKSVRQTVPGKSGHLEGMYVCMHGQQWEWLLGVAEAVTASWCSATIPFM